LNATLNSKQDLITTGSLSITDTNQLTEQLATKLEIGDITGKVNSTNMTSISGDVNLRIIPTMGSQGNILLNCEANNCYSVINAYTLMFSCLSKTTYTFENPVVL
jgi:hypothetical protein